MSETMKGAFDSGLISTLDPPDRFDLEQEIFKCWQVVDDIELIYSASDSIDANSMQNVLLGVAALYELKFNKLFQTYEHLLQKGQANNGL
jgi:hypothetical protein